MEGACRANPNFGVHRVLRRVLARDHSRAELTRAGERPKSQTLDG